MGTVFWQDLEFDPVSRALIRRGTQIVLGELETRALALLVQAEGEPVASDTLFRELWPDKTVSNSSLTQVIYRLRRALEPDGDLVIVSVPRVGYRTGVPWKSSEAPPPAVERRGPLSRRAILGSVAAAAAAAAGGLALLPTKAGRGANTPRVLRYTPITRDGLPKLGPALTGGNRIYYIDISAGSRVVSVPLTGGGGSGGPEPLQIPGLSLIYDFGHPSPDRRTAVLTVRGKQGNSGWIWRPGSTEATRLEGPADDVVAFDAHGPLVVFRRNRILSVTRPGQPARNFEMSGQAGNGIWPRDAAFLRVRVSEGETFSYWDVPSGPGKPRQVRFPGGRPARGLESGAWSNDGRYFVFRDFTGTPSIRGLQWARELGQSELSEPLPLTDDALNWSDPSFSSDGRTIYAFGSLTRSELVRFNRAGQYSETYLNGIPGMELDFSRDGKSIVYTRYPDQSLWITGSGGTEGKPLTPAGMVARMGHFSPDAQTVAFMGQRDGGPWRIYVMPVAGGGGPREPVAVSDSQEPQGVPTWSNDGRRILYGERLDPSKPKTLCIRVIDTATRKVDVWPDTDGLWTARWSPDGRYIAALTTDSKSVVVLDLDKGTRREIARFAFIGNPAWSADSRWIYGEVSELPEGRAVYRLHPDGTNVERLVDLTKFHTYGERWFGVTPGGEVIGTRSVYVSDLYALECEFPG